MKLSIHQAYFCSWIGQWQQLANSDIFILYNTQMMKSSYVNRNRIWDGNKVSWFTVPIKAYHLGAKICDVEVSDSWYGLKPFGVLQSAYFGKKQGCMKQYDDVMNAVFPEGLMKFDRNMSHNTWRSIHGICKYLDIKTTIMPSQLFKGSDIDDEVGKDKVLALCNRFKDSDKELIYINSSGGRELYNAEDFAAKDMKLQFFKPELPEYKDQHGRLVPKGLSIIDVMMRNPRDQVMEWVRQGLLED